MSVYNEPARYIRQSLDSVVNQTFQDFECIIVLDKPDRADVEAIIHSYNDSRLRFFKNEKNIGLALSMNTAASLAKAGIYARMDADDVAEPQKLERGFQVITEKNVDVVFSFYSYIDTESNDFGGRYKRIFTEGQVEPISISINPNQIHHPTVMMKKNIFDKVGGYRNFPCAQDSDLWMRMQENGATFYSIKEPLLKYRINPLGVTQAKFFKQSLTTLYIYSLSLERIRTGKDSYSSDNYQLYLKKHGINSAFQKKIFYFGDNLLTKAKRIRYPFDKLYRIAAFILVPQKRLYYCMMRKKKHLLS